MAKKHQEEDHGESAPLWIVSFCDLVTLMLSFFVILSVGNSKSSADDPKFAELVAALKAAFGDVQAATDAITDPKAEFAELVKKLMSLQTPQASGANGKKGDADDKGIRGRHFRVTRIREGLEMAMGGPVFFEPFAARPTEQGEKQLMEIVRILRGHRNVVEIRGHVGETPWPADWTYDNVMRLAYDRADYVGQVLRREGIDPRAIRLVSVGPNEPLKSDGLNPETIAASRRVQIVIRESLIDDWSTEKTARGSHGQSGSAEPTSRPNSAWNVDGPFAN